MKNYSRFHVLDIVSKYVTKEVLEVIVVELDEPRHCFNCGGSKRVVYDGLCHGCYCRWFAREKRNTKTIKGKRGPVKGIY